MVAEISPTILRRLLQSIEARGPDECWPWKKKGRANRYAMIGIAAGKSRGAHRLMWQLFVGPIPEGLEVCHTCDDGYCLNPRHHFLGTHTDNMQDKVRKGRCANEIPSVRGELHGQSKLTKEQVLAIRRRYDTGDRAPQIAKDFEVSRANVILIGKRKRWGWLTDSQ